MHVLEKLLSYLPIAGITFLVALLLVSAFVPMVRDFAVRIGAVQRGGGRRVHRGTVPNIGGIAIFAGFLIALLIGSLVRPSFLDAFRVELLAIVLGAALMTLVGFIDDIWEVPPVMRLGAQVVAAGILVVNGVRIDFLTNYLEWFFGDLGNNYLFLNETLSVGLTLLWVVGFTNAFNFIDGLDGLSSGMATISSFSILAVAVQFPDRGAAVLLLAALAGASLGFLRHNFSPAKIYMGDSGAYMLGYLLAAVSILGALKLTTVAVVAPVLMLALPVVNITQVTLRRMSRGVNPAVADNDHLHDLIRVRSGSKQFTVVVLWLMTLMLGLLGMMVSETPPRLMYTTAIGTVLLIGAASLLRFYEATRERQRSQSRAP